jgi:hypothetical protein
VQISIATCSSSGRYALGPDKHFIKYQADAHLESYREFSVFSGKFAQEAKLTIQFCLETLMHVLLATTSNISTGLPFEVDFDFTYFLIEDEIGTSSHTLLPRIFHFPKKSPVEIRSDHKFFFLPIRRFTP